MLRKSPTGNLGKQEESNGNAVEVSTREKLLKEQPELSRQFGMDLLPVLIQIEDILMEKLPETFSEMFVRAADVGVIDDLLQLKNLCMSLNAGIGDQKNHFPAVPSHPSRSSSGSGRISSGLSASSQQFKLRLCRAQGEESPGDYSSNLVIINPLASLAAVEEFLWPRVQRSDSGQKPSPSGGNSVSGVTPAGAGASSPSSSTPASTTHHHLTRSRSSVHIGDTAKKEMAQEKSSSSSKGKGKAVLKPTQEEGRGPQTRNGAVNLSFRFLGSSNNHKYAIQCHVGHRVARPSATVDGRLLSYAAAVAAKEELFL
ncbi:hypothetical protein NL676_039881 [Syzygium grande]|nr:hypothetical protein NL676_039881 [Syzygium grande]